jgi:murein DD-endopeptidase MepM/ murein hydrolase activator NlpD
MAAGIIFLQYCDTATHYQQLMHYQEQHALRTVVLPQYESLCCAPTLMPSLKGQAMISPETELTIANQSLVPVYSSAEKKLSPVRVAKPKKYTSTVRRRFAWQVPRTSFWISSRFGPRKKEDGSWGFHYGVDLAAPKGTPVCAADAGIVVESGYSTRGYGNTVVISHAKGAYHTRYAHLNRILVCVGQTVILGTRIGFVGDTGYVRGENGTHLHFEIKKCGRPVDPLKMLT